MLIFAFVVSGIMTLVCVLVGMSRDRAGVPSKVDLIRREYVPPQKTENVYSWKESKETFETELRKKPSSEGYTIFHALLEAMKEKDKTKTRIS